MTVDEALELMMRGEAPDLLAKRAERIILLDIERNANPTPERLAELNRNIELLKGNDID